MKRFLIVLFLLTALVSSFGQVRPDQFPLETNPTNENVEFYSQKNGLVKRVELDALKNYILRDGINITNTIDTKLEDFISKSPYRTDSKKNIYPLWDAPLATVSYSVDSGGDRNQAGPLAFSGGGRFNRAMGQYSINVGGVSNKAMRGYSINVGGYLNESMGAYSFNGGGRNNIVNSTFSSSLGGVLNKVYSTGGTITGGRDNYLPSGFDYCTITGGLNVKPTKSTTNTTFVPNLSIFNQPEVVDMSDNLQVLVRDSTYDGKVKVLKGLSVAGIATNAASITALQSKVDSINVNDGDSDPTNEIQDISGIATNAASITVLKSQVENILPLFVRSGTGIHPRYLNNIASGDGAVVNGGRNNRALGKEAVIGGGDGNQALKGDAVISGGDSNVADCLDCVINGGEGNYVGGLGGGSLSGSLHRVTADYSTIINGLGIKPTKALTHMAYAQNFSIWDTPVLNAELGSKIVIVRNGDMEGRLEGFDLKPFLDKIAALEARITALESSNN